jgi:hypothetical protein
MPAVAAANAWQQFRADFHDWVKFNGSAVDNGGEDPALLGSSARCRAKMCEESAGSRRFSPYQVRASAIPTHVPPGILP